VAEDANNVPRRRQIIESLRAQRLNLVHRARSFKTTSSLRIFTSISELYASLSPEEKKFFEKLDHEIEKVDTFYQEREREIQIKLVLMNFSVNPLTILIKIYNT
jgi:SPX domain protein involved in polyphosphate accumulation